MKRILKYVSKYKGTVIIGTMCMLIVIGVDLFLPYLQQIFIDSGLMKGNQNVIVSVLVWIGIITIIKAMLGYGKEFLYDVLSSWVHQDIKNDLFAHIQTLEFEYFDNMNTGELMSRIGEDAENIWQTIGYGMRLFIENIIYFVISTIILFILNYKLALACFIVMIPIGFIGIKLENKFGETYSKISDQTAEINTIAQEDIAGIKLVKAFSREKYEINKFLKMNKVYYDLNMEQAKIIGDYFPPIEFLTNIALVIMIVLGGFLVMDGEVSIGILVAFNGYIWNLIWPMRMLGELTDLLSRTVSSANKIFAIMDKDPSIKTKENFKDVKNIKGNIKFEGVNFKYDDKLVLKNINLDIKAGSTVAIMGATGAGKSSLINLIGRYYDTCKGSIKIDGIDIKEYNLEFLRKNMAIVPQETFLFSETILNNIKFSNENASFEEIKEASKLACANEFIEGLELGYNTEIGERGIGLSGGQKQRIAIARSLVRKAKILILDDSSSALDYATDAKLRHALLNFDKSLTTFIISQRTSSLMHCDQILVLDNGELVGVGTHEELLKNCEVYQEIHNSQFSSEVK